MSLRQNILVWLIFSGLACSDAPISPSKEHRELWESFGFHDYTYQQRRECFCFGAGRTVQILVQSDTITSATLIDTISTPFQGGSYLSIEALFDFVDARITLPGAKIEVAYDNQYGYPERVFFDPLPNAVDDEVLYVTSNLSSIK